MNANHQHVLDTVYSGYLEHYGEPRPSDPDLALLAGDRLYAEGLEELAEAGDLRAVTVLADVIAACARAHAEGRPQDAAGAWDEARRQLAS